MLDMLREAIQNRTPISLRYLKPGKTDGTRVGNPLVLFVATTGTTQLAFYQTSGATDSGQTLPGWRQFEIAHIQDLVLLKGEPRFTPPADYKPNDKRYDKAIEKVTE